ncbi:MAG: PKD domain-containing protein [bacterium]|nr:PKD domain-containing protein [bacterium]
MIRTKVIAGIIAAVGLLALIVPGCDELITEVNEKIIAGHPEADFSIGGDGKDSACVPFEVQFLDQSIGPISSWKWYFGDGDSSSDTNPVHEYDSDGVYNVILKVEHEPTEGEDTEEKKRYIIAGTAFTDFVSDTNQACLGSAVTFQPLQYGGVTSWSWDFDGDGIVDNTLDSTPTHVYDTIGLYTVTLTVDHANCGGKTLTKTDMINITACPTVVIHTEQPLAGCNPFTVQFYDSSTFDATEIALTDWEWDFGDNTKSYEQDPLHEYDVNGLYTVKLTVGSTGGSSTDSIVDMILVSDSAIASFVSLSPDTGCYTGFQDFAVAFSDSSIGDITSWQWDFGDDSTSTEQHPVHVYETPGIYSVSLEVSGSCGANTLAKSNLVVLSTPLDPATVAYSISPNPAILEVVGTDTIAKVIFHDSTPGVLHWNWDFGYSVPDGTGSLSEHDYVLDSTYEITLTLSNGCSEIQIIDTVEILPLP